MRFHGCDDEPDQLGVGHVRHISVAVHVIRGNDVQQPGAIEGGQFLPKNVEIALADLESIENRLRLRYHALNDHAARGGPIDMGSSITGTRTVSGLLARASAPSRYT